MLCTHEKRPEKSWNSTKLRLETLPLWQESAEEHLIKRRNNAVFVAALCESRIAVADQVTEGIEQSILYCSTVQYMYCVLYVK